MSKLRMDRERPIAQTVRPIRAALVAGTGFPVCPNCEGGSPFPGEDSAAAAAGTFAVSTAGDKKGRHLRFLPSLTTRFPCGVAYAVYHLRPSPLKERQEFKEEGKPWVSLPFCPRAGRRNVSLYRGATPRSDRRTACAFRAHRTAGVEKYSPRGNVSLRGSRASDSACRCSCNFRLKTPQKVLYYNHYTKENRHL